jgi:thymidylate kinase
VLRSRGGDSLFDQANYERVVELYYEELAKFVSVTVDATQSVETVVGECLSVIDRWQQDAEWRQR